METGSRDSEGGATATQESAPNNTTTSAGEDNTSSEQVTGANGDPIGTGTGDAGTEGMERGALSPLTGSYLLIVLAEPYSDEDREVIIQRLIKGTNFTYHTQSSIILVNFLSITLLIDIFLTLILCRYRQRKVHQRNWFFCYFFAHSYFSSRFFLHLFSLAMLLVGKHFFGHGFDRFLSASLHHTFQTVFILSISSTPLTLYVLSVWLSPLATICMQFVVSAAFTMLLVCDPVPCFFQTFFRRSTGTRKNIIHTRY